jgi:hypothetical protein
MAVAGILEKFDVVDADDLASVNVDDLLVEQVPREKKQTFRPIRDPPEARPLIRAHVRLGLRSAQKPADPAIR